jgi:hypothetical protein
LIIIQTKIIAPPASEEKSIELKKFYQYQLYLHYLLYLGSLGSSGRLFFLFYFFSRSFSFNFFGVILLYAEKEETQEFTEQKGF